MSEKLEKNITLCVDMAQFAKAIVATCAMVEAAVEQYDESSVGFNEGIFALGNEMKTHANCIYEAVIESSKTISLTTKISVKAEIDKLDNLIDAFEQVMKRRSDNKKKGIDDEK